MSAIMPRKALIDPNHPLPSTSRPSPELVAAKKIAFLEAYAISGIVTPALKAANVCRQTYQGWMREDEEFAEAAGDARLAAIENAEEALRQRGVEGDDEIVIYKGEPVWKRDVDGNLLLDDDFNPIPWTIKAKSDRLLELYMKAHDPKYREKNQTQVELSGPGGGPVQNNFTVTYVLPEGKTKEDYDRLEEFDT